MKTFNAIYNELSTGVKNFIAFRIGNDIETAEEITNDVFLKVFNNLDKFDETKSKLSTWVFAIAKNAVIDHMRKRKLATQSISEFADENGNEFLNPATNEKNGFQQIINTELTLALDDSFNNLSERYKQVADLYFNCHLSYDEIAQGMYMKMGTVKATISRIRDKMQIDLDDYKTLLNK